MLLNFKNFSQHQEKHKSELTARGIKPKAQNSAYLLLISSGKQTNKFQEEGRAKPSGWKVESTQPK
jgi:hypothetical protein